MKIEELEANLKGATHANLKQIAKEYFTPEFLEREATMLFTTAKMAEGLPFFVNHRPSELDKCVIHYCSRELISDLWGFSTPTLSRFVADDGRFRLDDAFAEGEGNQLATDVRGNLEVGKRLISDMTHQLWVDWVQDLGQRHKRDPRDQAAVMFTIYRSYSMLLCGGDWSVPTIMEATFTSAGRENFDWVRDYPDMSRAELEEIVENSMADSLELAKKLGIKSHTREKVLRDAIGRGELAYVLDPLARKIVFNPLLLDELTREEEKQQQDYPDQTHLVLMCPANYVSSTLYPSGSMLQDLIRFRASVYTEIYLATHSRR